MPEDSQGWRQRPIVSEQSVSTRSGPEPSRFDPAAAYLEQPGVGSRRSMREALSKLADWASEGRCDSHDLPWQMLRIEHTAALRTRLTTTLAPATTNKHLAALRGVLKQCWRRGLMSAEADQRAIDLPPVRGTSPRKLNKLGAFELQKLARTCTGDTSPAGARDEALLALLYGANLHRSEAVALEIEDYDLAPGVLDVRAPGDRPARRFGANEDARRALERWILIPGSRGGPPFQPAEQGWAHRAAAALGASDLHRLPKTRGRSGTASDEPGRLASSGRFDPSRGARVRRLAITPSGLNPVKTGQV